MTRLGILLAATLLVCGCSGVGFKKEVSVRESFGPSGCGQKYEVKLYRK
jgi:hypothetical protein